MIKPRNRPAVGDRTVERCTPREYNAEAGSSKLSRPKQPRLGFLGCQGSMSANVFRIVCPNASLSFFCWDRCPSDKSKLPFEFLQLFVRLLICWIDFQRFPVILNCLFLLA